MERVRRMPLGGLRLTSSSSRRLVCLLAILGLETVLIIYRSRGFLHVHDSGGGWWQKSSDAQVPGRLPAFSEGQLHRMAVGSSAELPDHSHSVPDCELLSYCHIDGHQLTSQQPFVSTIGIFWTAYLSMNNASEEVIATPGSSPA